jgi:1-acyl-sn-glycerol-3-phosphate acyltransferase
LYPRIRYGIEVTETAACGPDQLADAIIAFVARKAGRDESRVRDIVERIVAEAGHGAVERLQARLGHPADRWGYYERDLLAQRVHHDLAPVVLSEPPRVKGAAHLDALRGHPAIIVANHLSYSDANVIEYLLHQNGHGELADRLAVIAGPKVYSDLSRRFSSLCFGTIKSPQNESVSSGEAAMTARDVALAARETLATAHARLSGGDVLLLFPEGTRSRSGGMQPFLAGVARYFDGDDVPIVPIGLCGTEHMFAIGEERLGSANITMSIGPPLRSSSLFAIAGGNRRRFVDLLGAAVAVELPAPYRGAYA